jgi:hypothetical protein
MDRRVKFRQGLSSLYLPYYESLCGLLGPEWQPYYGLRTFPEQDALYAQGREGRPGPRVTNARGGESPHNYGCATDWCPWDSDGKPYWPEGDDPIWAPYLAALEKVGLRAGHDFKDTPHNELSINCSWKHVFLVFSQNGMTAAQQKIEIAASR